jgi:hypothetical protein
MGPRAADPNNQRCSVTSTLSVVLAEAKEVPGRWSIQPLLDDENVSFDTRESQFCSAARGLLPAMRAYGGGPGTGTAWSAGMRQPDFRRSVKPVIGS